MRTFHKALILLAVSAFSLSAGSFSFTGSFTSDDQVQLFDLSLSSTSVVTFETLSYGGGTNSALATIPPGGFEPRLTWFQADGAFIGSDHGEHCSDTNSYLGACDDAYFSGPLDAGSYILALTEDGNDPNGDLGAGFMEQGNGNFTATGSCLGFCDSLSGAQLTGNWAVDILNVDSAGPAVTIPEPGTPALTGSLLALLALAGLKRRLSGQKGLL